MVKYEHKIGITKDTPVENYVTGEQILDIPIAI